MQLIEYEDFFSVDIRIGTIIRAKENNLLKKPSIILEIDFGNGIGIKKSLAQLQAVFILYTPQKDSVQYHDCTKGLSALPDSPTLLY